MFLRESEPVLLTEEGLEALCVSLNRPVVDLEDLPASPARAAIAVHRSEDGLPCLAVALRSIDAGVVCAYTFRGAPHGSVHQALDVGLSFAEAMGFLFDEDMLGQAAIGMRNEAGETAGLQRADAAARASEIWHELIGEARPLARPPRPPPGPAPLSKFRHAATAAVTAVASDASELMLELELEVAPEPPAAPVPDPAVAPEPETESGETTQTQLGRISIVRKRRRTDTYANADFETRLVASF